MYPAIATAPEQSFLPQIGFEAFGQHSIGACTIPGSDEMAVRGGVDTERRDALTLEHLALVRSTARRLAAGLPRSVELEELISAGMLGLMDAATKYQTVRGIPFKSYACTRIRGAMVDYLRMLDWGPRELRRQSRAMDAALRAATQRLGRTPSESEVASEMGISLPVYQELLGSLHALSVGSLNDERTEGSGDEELSYIPAREEESPLFQLFQAEQKELLTEAIDALPEKERLVLTLYYYEELNMKEIGAILGVVESRVSQIRSAAIRRLRSSMGQNNGVHAKAAA